MKFVIVVLGHCETEMTVLLIKVQPYTIIYCRWGPVPLSITVRNKISIYYKLKRGGGGTGIGIYGEGILFCGA